MTETWYKETTHLSTLRPHCSSGDGAGWRNGNVQRALNDGSVGDGQPNGRHPNPSVEVAGSREVTAGCVRQPRVAGMKGLNGRADAAVEVLQLV